MADGSGNYVMYLRKSRADLEAEQRGEGETLARHEHALLELANRLQLNPLDIYREVASGESIAARPVMQKLLSEVEAGLWAGVLVMEVERLARGDTIDQGIVAQAFKFSGTKIITPSKTYDPDNEFDEEYFEFGLFMSRREYKTINRRLQRGRVASVKEGKYVASTPPYGYSRQKLEHDKGYVLTPNPEEAQVVKMIFTLYTSGEERPDGTRERLGVSRIVRRLNDLKIPPQRGDVWTPPSVRDMLKNPVYIGKLRWNWRKSVKRRDNGDIVISRPRSVENLLLASGRHEPIITPDIFYAAQEYLAAKNAPSVREKGVIQNPLAGLVVCGKCGRRMQRRPYLKQGLPPSLICTNTACDNVSSDLAKVEASILSSLRQWLEDYRLTWGQETEHHSESVNFHKKAAAKLDREITNLEKQRENLHDLLERGVYDTDTFLDRSRIIAARLKQAESDRVSIMAELRKEQQREVSRENIIPKIEHLLDVYDTLTPSGKNFMLKEVLEKVVYRKELHNRWSNPDHFSIDLFPKIPQIGEDF
ncbi:MAG: recombinase family protein [Oscillibacter sp.]|nr:recombinase family protein [Oscillibacter sp.]